MSLTVYLHGPERETECCCAACGHRHSVRKSETYYTANITHNLIEMAEAAGLLDALWYPERIVIGQPKASDLIGPLEAGLERLRYDSHRFSALAPRNGWGTYGGLVCVVVDYLDACRAHPDALVEVDR